MGMRSGLVHYDISLSQQMRRRRHVFYALGASVAFIKGLKAGQTYILICAGKISKSPAVIQKLSKNIRLACCQIYACKGQYWLIMTLHQYIHQHHHISSTFMVCNNVSASQLRLIDANASDFQAQTSSLLLVPSDFMLPSSPSAS